MIRRKTSKGLPTSIVVYTEQYFLNKLCICINIHWEKHVFTFMYHGNLYETKQEFVWNKARNVFLFHVTKENNSFSLRKT